MRHLQMSSVARAYVPEWPDTSSVQQPRHSPTRLSLVSTYSASLSQAEHRSDGAYMHA